MAPGGGYMVGRTVRLVFGLHLVAGESKPCRCPRLCRPGCTRVYVYRPRLRLWQKPGFTLMALLGLLCPSGGMAVMLMCYSGCLICV